jgi:hypothetical protein
MRLRPLSDAWPRASCPLPPTRMRVSDDRCLGAAWWSPVPRRRGASRASCFQHLRAQGARRRPRFARGRRARRYRRQDTELDLVADRLGGDLELLGDLRNGEELSTPGGQRSGGPPPPDVLSAGEVAALLHVSRPTGEDWARRGVIPSREGRPAPTVPAAEHRNAAGRRALLTSIRGLFGTHVWYPRAVAPLHAPPWSGRKADALQVLHKCARRESNPRPAA